VEDVEMAAQGSYAYWVAKHSSNPPTEEQKIKMAMREARRHIYGVKYPDAVKNIKETCKYRRVSETTVQTIYFWTYIPNFSIPFNQFRSETFRFIEHALRMAPSSRPRKRPNSLKN
jgi:hypothetical protein